MKKIALIVIVSSLMLCSGCGVKGPLERPAYDMDYEDHELDDLERYY